jgi:ribosomal protein S18 acetylase RimI-like enzyme
VKKAIDGDPYIIRPMYTDDLPDVCDLEQEAFPDRPWHEEEFVSLISLKAIEVQVCEYYGQIVGHIATSRRSPKGRVMILTLAVRKEHRRQGIASKLLASVMEREESRSSMLAALVRETNLAGAMFFARNGFVGSLVPAPYEDTDEDGIEFKFPLPCKVKTIPLRRVPR